MVKHFIGNEETMGSIPIAGSNAVIRRQSGANPGSIIGSHSTSDTLTNAYPLVAILISTLLVICFKTGEKPEWCWGLSWLLRFFP